MSIFTSQVARDLVVGVGRIGARALIRGAQSVAQDAIQGLGKVREHVKATHDRLEGIVEAPPVQNVRAPAVRR